MSSEASLISGHSISILRQTDVGTIRTSEPEMEHGPRVEHATLSIHRSIQYIALTSVSQGPAVCTVEPLNNVTFGTSYSVHYREVSFLRRL